jgi:hypothetical protein
MLRDHWPPRLPAKFWDRPDVVQALTDRDLGTVVREFRKWTGATQTDISILVGIPQPHVSELERGVRRVSALSVFERFADGLGAPRHLLGLADQNGKLPTVPADPVQANQREWLHTRQLLNQHRSELTRLALRLYPPAVQVGETGLLMAPTWRLVAPLDLRSIELELLDDQPPGVTGREDETRPLRPLASPGHRYETYHRTMRDLDRPRLFENRICYRMRGFSWSEGHGRLMLGHMRYFDMIDVSEALAHELALRTIDHNGNIHPERASWENLAFRRLVRDPFELEAYPLLLSVSTLTIRRSRAGSTFLLLRRNVGQVAIAGGMLSVMPTGVFQPASILPITAHSPDFDLWRNMMREYSEEFLGNPEHDGSGDPIDYASEEPFRSLDAARAAGRIRVLCVGVGVDALNLVGDILTVAVFDAAVFDDIFRGLVEVNDEGTVTRSGPEREEFTFDGASIEHLLATEPIAPSGAACLALAWQHRDVVMS